VSNRGGQRCSGCALRGSSSKYTLIFPCAGLAPQAVLWAGLGALSRTINEREKRNAMLSLHNVELRAASATGDDLLVLQVLARCLCSATSFLTLFCSCA